MTETAIPIRPLAERPVAEDVVVAARALGESHEPPRGGWFGRKR